MSDIDRAREVFDEAVKQPAAERAEFVRARCGDDLALAQEVIGLLREFVEAPTITDDRLSTVSPERIPERVGRYQILYKIGEGGMGVVYAAELDKPRLTVALKLIRTGFPSVSLLRRFEAEAEILARLQHPGIAQIYDAGTMPVEGGDGLRPYFAMELVRGKPLTEYAAEHNLGVSQRLELLIKICQAVQHAHGRGVIHRDLKPANILVDESGQPKILDFGVARATDADIQVTTSESDLGQLIGTLAYMSPEQARGDPKEVDARSDVYAIGVIAFELLSGRMPYDLAGRMVLEAVRVIVEEDPTKLSTLDRTLRGDLEVIVGAALEKDKERRYETAAELATELQRYLNNEPIVRHPPGVWYQTVKFARRNKAFVGGVAAVFVVLVLGLAGTSYGLKQAIEARNAEAEQKQIARSNEQKALDEAARADLEALRARTAEEAEKKRADELRLVAEFQSRMLSDIDVELMGLRLREDVLVEARSAMDRLQYESDRVTAQMGDLTRLFAGTNFTNAAVRSLDRNVLQRALEAIDKQFVDQPLVRANLLQTVADAYMSLGLYSRACPPQEKALELRVAALGLDHRDTLTSNNNLGIVFLKMSDHETAARVLRGTVERRRLILGPDHPDTLTSIHDVAMLLAQQGELVQAETLLRQSYDGRLHLLGPDHWQTLQSLGHLAVLLGQMKKLPEAGALARKAFADRRRVLGPLHIQTLESQRSLAKILEAEGHLVEAHDELRELLKVLRGLYGDYREDTMVLVADVAKINETMGRPEEAERYWHEALTLFRSAYGPGHPRARACLTRLALLLRKAGRLSEAEAYCREAVAINERVLGESAMDTLHSLFNLGHVLEMLEKWPEAERYYTRAVNGLETRFGADHSDTWTARLGLVRVCIALGNWNRAEDEVLKSESAPPNRLDTRRQVLDALVALYAKRHVAEPGKGYDAKAAEWRAKLEALTGQAEPAGDSSQEKKSPEGDRAGEP